ncbi:hypothetical protein PULV_a0938 [Pseudoalteromonas ulvae UL12]|uniref:Diguanylate cyclase n=1 Tax=Pseudoalteromonas ulvae TaxID=107327 RepID=A0A244CSZ7_PSEDV|nr:diguanylate cyclase [Pseudoalteromonas ulvae]MBE0363487.1 hypothetical protein [Pseudoalteromonas ulvae UL12]OUL58359.1 diguanylate cyclase [Pseudoalteromonas ulvae]
MIFSFQNASFRDHDTGLYNQAYFMEVFNREWHRLIRDQDALTVILVDPHVNLRDEQQKILFVELANILKLQTYRSTDLVCRFNDNYFALGLFGLNQGGTNVIIERIQAAIKTALGESFGAVNICYGAVNVHPNDTVNIEMFFQETLGVLHAAELNGVNSFKITQYTQH